VTKLIPDRLKIALIGAGSLSFGRGTIADIVLSETLNQVPIDLVLMDIVASHLDSNQRFAEQAVRSHQRAISVNATTDLAEALTGAHCVVTAIEVERYKYWMQDFHVPRKYGFTQIYGENGGPGGLFHTLRNMGPMLDIAQAMQQLCPEAWLINFTNPEAKLVEAISRLSTIKVVGLCHGVYMGREQLARILELPEADIETVACGLNHFGWFQKIQRRSTGEDLYPRLTANESQAHWLAAWDEIALSRILFRTFGLWPYPGANHCGEYFRWSRDFFAGDRFQYFHDPVWGAAWEQTPPPTFLYSTVANPNAVPFFPEKPVEQLYPEFDATSEMQPDALQPSGEDAVRLIEALCFDQAMDFPALNLPNHGAIPGLDDELVVEIPARADGRGIQRQRLEPLPEGVTAMIRLQGSIHKLLIEAYQERSRNKLLQAVLLDPTVSSYANAVAMINEMCELQKELLPVLEWKEMRP